MNQNEFVQIITPFKDKLFRLAKRMLISTEEAEGSKWWKHDPFDEACGG